MPTKTAKPVSAIIKQDFLKVLTSKITVKPTLALSHRTGERYCCRFRRKEK